MIHDMGSARYREKASPLASLRVRLMSLVILAMIPSFLLILITAADQQQSFVTDGSRQGITIPDPAAVARSERIIFTNFIGLLAVTGLTLGAAWFGSEFLVLRQVRNLVDTTRKLASGELSVRVASPRNAGELSELANAFNDMAAALEERDNELKRSHLALTSEIAERKVLLSALRDSERRFRAVFEQSFQFVGLLNADGILLEANQSALEFGGLTPTDVVGRPFWETYWWGATPDTRALLQAAIAEAASGRFIRYEVDVLGKDSAMVTIDFSLKPIKDEAGKVVLIISEGRDITERKQAEDALRRTEKLYRTLAQNLPQTAIMLFDQDLRYLIVEGSLLDTLGNPRQSTREKYEGKTVYDVLPPEQQAQFAPMYQAALEGKTSITEIVANGQAFQIQFIPVRNEDGAIFSGMVMLQDITERKQADDARRQSEERLRLLVQNMPVMMAAFDSNRNIIAWNRECEQVTGYSADEMIGNPDAMALLYPDPTYRERMLAEWSNRGHQYRDWEWKVRCKDGTIKTVSWFNISRQFPIPGWDAWSIGVDVTERVSAENALRDAHRKLEIRVRERTADLRAANEELSSFTYIVSHDLRAPLVNLKGFAGELRESVGIIDTGISTALPHLDEQQSADVLQAIQKDIPEALAFIESSVARMDHLTSAVLKLSRMGRRELNPEPINMDTLVQAIVNSLAHQIKQKQAAVTIGPLPEVNADRTAIEQIMGNLLSNAVNYLRPNCPGLIEVTGESSGDEATFHIKDNGRGIAPDDSHKVFEPFRRAGKPDTPGEGMGLAYTQAMVRRHGGRIWYTSQLGEGTTFSFTISNDFTKREQP